MNWLLEKYVDYKIWRMKKADKLYESKIVKLFNDCVLANHEKLNHIQLCAGTLPKYYIDKPFTCRDCGSKEVWTAVKQKHYFEENKGKHLGALAIRCKPCRKIKHQAKIELQKHMEEKSNKKRHPNELFFRDKDEFRK